jgi:predicted ATPase
VNVNKEYRDLTDALSQVRYLHVVPQLVREPDRSVGKKRDPYGGDFLEQLAMTNKKTLESRLRRITTGLQVAVPQLQKLELKRDEKGVPHLRGLYKHWRPNAGWQAEDQFSDGTLRLLGLLWSFLDGHSPLLLEEPELSLNVAVVRHVPRIISRMSRKGGRQIIVSTHSADLLADPGIALEEVLLIEPTDRGSEIGVAADNEQVRALVDGGLPVGEAALPRTAPTGVERLAEFGAS